MDLPATPAAPRRRPTEAELRLWPWLRRRLPSLRFRRDDVLGPYRASYVCHAPPLVIDIEGDRPGDVDAAARAARSAWLAGQGYLQLCFGGAQVLDDPEAVAEAIAAELPWPDNPPCALQPDDERWMRQAMAVAERAAQAGEVPVGAVLVSADGEVLAEGWNLPISLNDASAHAEMLALRRGGERLANYRLAGTTLYVTLEPCLMCAGAIIHARVSRLVYAARDDKAGAVDSVYDVIARPRLNHRVQWRGGVLEAEAAAMLRAFFQQRRDSR